MSGVFSWRNLIRQNYKTALFASSACFLCTKYNNYEAYRSNEKLYKNYDRYFTRFCNSLMSPFSIKCYALTKKQREQLMTKQTDVYVWGNGYQVDFSLDYNNFFPKKISNFDGEGKPQIIMVKFGLFHEAYLDKTGKIHLCSKHKLPSMKIPNQDDRFRSDMAILEVKGRKVIDMCFTDKSGAQGRLFALTDKGEVFVWKIDYILPNDFKQKGGFIHNDIINEYEVAVMKEPTHITELKNIEQIVSGSDHFLALDKNGEVWAMGDDTFGQCGQEAGNRPEVPPFKEKRISKPTKVRLPAKAVKIASGYRHSFAISTNGELYGWGYNNQQQLSHSEEFAAETTPKHVIFEPVKITKEIESRRVVDVAGGKDFSLIVTKNRDEVQEVWATGNNLRGQLGINRISHLQDIQRVDDISGFVDSSKQKPLNIALITCGRRHSMLLFEYGAFYIWGDNEIGQMGDRSRKIMESPFPKAKFELKHNVLNIEAGFDNCGVIVERLPENIRDKDDEEEKQKKKKTKREAKTLQDLPKPILVEQKPPTAFERFKNKIRRLWQKRELEKHKMKEIQAKQNEEKENNEENIEVINQNESKDESDKK